MLGLRYMEFIESVLYGLFLYICFVSSAFLYMSIWRCRFCVEIMRSITVRFLCDCEDIGRSLK